MRRWLLMAVVALFALPAALRAEISLREARVYCVDIVLLKGGVELRGSVLSRNEKELKIAVQRNWLADKQPDMAKKYDEEAATQAESNRQELINRITTWKDERAADTRLVSSLKHELERLAKLDLKAAAPASQFLIVTVPVDQLKRVFQANVRSRQLAMAAWEQQLPDVESSPFGALRSEVQKKAPGWEQATINLADRLPMGESQSPDEWAARQAIFEYEYRQRVDFQGTGNFLVRVGEGAERPNLAEILSQTAAEALKGGLAGGELSGLGLDLGVKTQVDPSATINDWLPKVIEQVSKLDARGFCVTRVPSITGTGPATVTTHFYARMSDGKYREIWSSEVTTDPASLKSEDIERVEQDPQVQEITKVAKALSLDDNATTAVQFGAAIQASLKASQSRFFDFRQRYNNTLDGPSLILPLMTEKK